MANAPDPFDPLGIRQDPLRAICDQLTPLVINNFPWWRAAIRRWASKKKCVAIPLPRDLTTDEQAAVLAAIYDYYTDPTAQIDPWHESDDPPAYLPDEYVGPIPGIEPYFKALDEGIATYARLVDQVPSLREQWDRRGPKIESLIVDVAKQLKTNQPGELSSSTTAKKKLKKAGPKAKYSHSRDKDIADLWKRAKETGAYKAHFARDHGMSANELDQLLDRVAWHQRKPE